MNRPRRPCNLLFDAKSSIVERMFFSLCSMPSLLHAITVRAARLLFPFTTDEHVDFPGTFPGVCSPYTVRSPLKGVAGGRVHPSISVQLINEHYGKSPALATPLFRTRDASALLHKVLVTGTVVLHEGCTSFNLPIVVHVCVLLQLAWTSKPLCTNRPLRGSLRSLPNPKPSLWLPTVELQTPPRRTLWWSHRLPWRMLGQWTAFQILMRKLLKGKLLFGPMPGDQ